MNNYELTVLLRAGLADSLKEKVTGILQKHNVKITEDKSWGVKKLAYEIDREKEAYYFFALLEASPEAIKPVIADFRLNSDILRFLFVYIEQPKSA
jgi:small subunit ribosomal protein S6